jgi:hypothetical protein
VTDPAQAPAGCRRGRPRSLAELAARAGGPIRLAVDTEFDGTHTLLVQYAARLGRRVLVQVYHSPAVVPPDRRAVRRRLRRGLGRLGRRLTLRPFRPIRPDLSPARVLADLFALPGLAPSAPPAGGAGEPAETVDVTLVGHFLDADLFRAFGRGFLAAVLTDPAGPRAVVRAGRGVGLAGPGPAGRFRPPVVEHAADGGGRYAVRLATADTCRAFGSHPLDALARAFAGAGKAGDLTAEEKRRMADTLAADPVRVTAYAAADAVLTLAVDDRMRAAHRAMAADLGFAGEPPPYRPTLGARVADLLARAAVRMAGAPAGDAGSRAVRRLFRAGGGAAVADDSKFAGQTADVHGGLLLSRSPGRVYHHAPGMLRDVDLAGCYPAVLERMRVYLGRPVAFEPGGRGVTLREAVALCEREAAGWDAWMIKASGPLPGAANVLVPSALEAVTHRTYASRARRRRAVGDKPPGTALFSDAVEAGVVTYHTWTVIQSLPPALRRAYEELEVETVLLYPKGLTADTWAGYGELVRERRSDRVPWSAVLDLDGLCLRERREFTDEHVALAVPLGPLVGRLLARRRAGRDRHGPGSAAARVWKETANSLYGVLASRHVGVHSVVAANVVTGTARAAAYALTQSLNALQVVTDGCVYRRDRVPAATLADCLRAAPDYPLDADAWAGPYLDPAAVPEDDAAFTAWYPAHARQFFGSAAGGRLDELLAMHALAHKWVGPDRRPAFDALCCDGGANNVKLVDGPGGPAVAEAKLRGYSGPARGAVAGWAAGTYAAGRYAPPPVAECVALLRYPEAVTAARAAVRDGAAAARVPLGAERRRVLAYRVVRPSSFVFRTPRQRAAFRRACERFAGETGCGPEALALRRPTGGRAAGELEPVLRSIHALIRDGTTNFCKALNLTRLCGPLADLAAARVADLARRRAAARDALRPALDPGWGDPTAVTGLVVDLAALARLG